MSTGLGEHGIRRKRCQSPVCLGIAGYAVSYHSALSLNRAQGRKGTTSWWSELALTGQGYPSPPLVTVLSKPHMPRAPFKFLFSENFVSLKLFLCPQMLICRYFFERKRTFLRDVSPQQQGVQVGLLLALCQLLQPRMLRARTNHQGAFATDCGPEFKG